MGRAVKLLFFCMGRKGVFTDVCKLIVYQDESVISQMLKSPFQCLCKQVAKCQKASEESAPSFALVWR